MELVEGYTPIGGEVYSILRADYEVRGAFDEINVPSLPVGLHWRYDHVDRGNFKTVDLSVVERLASDHNGDGVVNAADYTVWQDSFGSTTALAADGNCPYALGATVFGREDAARIALNVLLYSISY